MKKFLSLLLAAVMLLSCTAAFAESEPEQPTVRADENMTNVVSGAAQFNQDTNSTVPNLGGATSATQRTDVWLQVDASGQIDVTVPLVAVFKTNIDGGKDAIENTYKMVNNSSAALAVTKVVIEDQNTDVTVNGNTSNMKMVENFTDPNKTYDEYKLTILPKDHYNTPKWTVAQNVASANSANNTISTKFEKTTNGTKHVYTLDSGSVYNSETPGLWLIDRANDTDATDESYINLNLETSKLSFVTQKKDTDLNADKENYTENDTIENGIKLFTITYTVKIDDSGAVGEDIKKYNIPGSKYSSITEESPETIKYGYNGTYIFEHE